MGCVCRGVWGSEGGEYVGSNRHIIIRLEYIQNLSLDTSPKGKFYGFNINIEFIIYIFFKNKF